MSDESTRGLSVLPALVMLVGVALAVAGHFGHVHPLVVAGEIVAAVGLVAFVVYAYFVGRARRDTRG